MSERENKRNREKIKENEGEVSELCIGMESECEWRKIRPKIWG